MNLDKINQMLVDKQEKNNCLIVDGDIQLKNVEYETNGKIIFSSLNLFIKQKSKIFFTGQSGKGKSTLLKLLIKYDSRYKGEIFIGNINLSDVSRKQIVKNITYISQNEELFTSTIKDNLLLNRKIPEQKLNKIIDICELKEVINAKKLGLDTLVEEGGFNFSGGERQRIILARALLKDSKYILIDEALSEVDLSLEKKIVAKILNYFQDKTIIYVSHKKEIKELFEKIFNIEGGVYEK